MEIRAVQEVEVVEISLLPEVGPQQVKVTLAEQDKIRAQNVAAEEAVLVVLATPVDLME
jgi:hypothetical protein